MYSAGQTGQIGFIYPQAMAGWKMKQSIAWVYLQGFRWHSCRALNHKVTSMTSIRSKWGNAVMCRAALSIYSVRVKTGIRSGKWRADWWIGMKVCRSPPENLVWRSCAISGKHSKALWQPWNLSLKRTATRVMKSKCLHFWSIHLMSCGCAKSFYTSYKWPMA